MRLKHSSKADGAVHELLSPALRAELEGALRLDGARIMAAEFPNGQVIRFELQVRPLMFYRDFAAVEWWRLADRGELGPRLLDTIHRGQRWIENQTRRLRNRREDRPIMNIELDPELERRIRIIVDAVPNSNMREGVELWLRHGKGDGGFMRAMLSNNLTDAAGHADTFNQRLLFEWAVWLQNRCPLAAWGSVERCQEWERAGGLVGLEQKGRELAAATMAAGKPEPDPPAE